MRGAFRSPTKIVLSVIGTLDKPDCGPGEKKSAYQRNKSNIVASGGTF
jgi:hypothetical protein